MNGRTRLIPTIASTFDTDRLEGEVNLDKVSEGGWEGGVLCDGATALEEEGI
jgi:hypothetical protein